MIVLVGKSGSGKDTIVRELVKQGCNKIITYTTRPPRKGEINGVTYHFITPNDFKRKENNGFFLETTSYNVASGETWYYGTSLESINNANDEDVIILNPDGLKALNDLGIENKVVFYLMVTDEVLLARLTERGDSKEEYLRRLKADENDFKNISKYADMVIKNESILPDMVASIIKWSHDKIARGELNTWLD